MSGLLQRLVSQARAPASAAGVSRVRSAMSVHAQVPLEGATAVDSERHMADSGSQPSCPWPAIYMSDPANPAGDAALLREELPQLPLSEPARSRPASAPQPEITERTHTRTEKHLVERTPTPQPMFAISPEPSIAPQVNAPLFNATAERESRIRPDAPQRESTEVHVHIGRIEVIAAPDTVAPKKPQKPTSRPTVPLADYLAKRARP